MDSIQEQQLALILQSSFRARYCNVAVSLILYDFALTLPKEVSLFWRAPSKALSGTIIFAINRLIAVGLLVTGNASMDRTSTYASFRTSTLVQIPFILGSILVWAVISGIRVHALAGRSWILTLLTVLLAFVPLATNTYLVTTNTFTVYKVGWLVVCHESSPIPRERDEICARIESSMLSRSWMS
ncbi:uncharacterized protein C8Q71DRAFT_392203 [Rhodofomes roseus]|uniref:DUF6533 domain-containing protein n=1 Tax=Rhodofomes roseus TaxID=34475 RepID=A0ABQ8K0Y5_9APHY|nr:uncharacterized protein C8Q71DRAFT_392203 [Rhodofomes roseus]KAH9829878.1 hypothetical protein C8Q71DRAFT_392203 [Rhodofomes roseus]